MNPDSLLLADLVRQLRNRRKAKRMTQRALAELCNISENTVLSLEHGQRNVSMLTVLRVARELGVSVNLSS